MKELQIIKNEINNIAEGKNIYDIKEIINPETNKQVLENIKNVGEIIKTQLKSGMDYGTIPGVKKPFLWMAGAEKISIMFGFSPKFEIIDKEIKLNGARTKQDIYILYIIKCSLTKINKNGEAIVINEGYGAANNLERAKINADQAGLVNNLLKIAKKRAFVDAVKSIAAVSDVFTQDEDLMANATEKVAKNAKMQIYRAVYKSLEIDINKETHKEKAKKWIQSEFQKWALKNEKGQSSPMDEFNKEEFKLWFDFIKSEAENHVYNSKRGAIVKR